MSKEPKDIKLNLTMEEFYKAKELADKKMKKSNGHSFVTILKTRCQFCGRSPRQKGKCRAWFQTFLFDLDTILINEEYKKGE